MDSLRHDVIFAFRMLRRERAYAAAVILTLAVCLGASAAIYTVVRSVLIRPLPYPDAGEIVFSYDSFPGAGVERAGTSVPNYVDRAGMTDVFESVALYQRASYRLGQGAGAERIQAINVTPSFFDVLRAGVLRGRRFTDEDAVVGRNKVAVVTHQFAARAPGGVEGLVGSRIRLNDELYDVVGVFPEAFHFLDDDIRVFVPLAFTPEERAEDRRYSQSHQQVARLASGVTLEQAQARMDAVTAAHLESAGSLRQLLVDVGYSTELAAFEADLVRGVRSALQMLWGGVLLVVLIAAVNITNLSFVRASGRAKELATRNAVGAPVRRIARQLITETLLLTLIGGALGLVLGFWSLDALAWLGLSDLPRADEIRMDGAVFAFTFGLAAILGVVVGAIPAIQLRRANLANVLRDEGRGGTAGPRTRHVRRVLVVSQVSLAFVLIVGAGLLFTSFQRLLAVDPGFVSGNVLTARLSLLETQYPDEDARRQYVSRVLERVRALPGIEAAGITDFLPFGGDDRSNAIIAEGQPPKPGESIISPRQLIVTPGYLQALQVKLVRGRFFDESDTANAPRVVIVDEQLANRFWPNADPIGRRVYFPGGPDDIVAPGPNTTWLRVVGVVASVKLRGLVEAGEDARKGAYYLAFAQAPQANIAIAVRSTGEPDAASAAVQRAILDVDPETPASDVLAMTQRIEDSLVTRRAPMVLTVAFGAVALLLAAVGLYGVLAYQVSQRTREFGIRLALGGHAAGILGLVLREGAWLVVVGLAAGLAGAWALGGVVTSQLYDVGVLDPMVILMAAVVLAVTSLVACLGPARRAARVDPIVALSR
jgi:predicted permease